LLLASARREKFLALASAIVIALPSVAQERGNTDPGRCLAAHCCGKCHVVAPRGVGRDDAASSFQAIADLETTTALSLRVFLTPEESDDIISLLRFRPPHWAAEIVGPCCEKRQDEQAALTAVTSGYEAVTTCTSTGSSRYAA
jgi:hypothetical protein